MNVSKLSHPRRLGGLLAAFGTLTAILAVGGTAMAAQVPPPGGGNVPLAPSAVPAAAGMPGWQIALIAVAAALVAAVLAVLADRARTARRRLAAPPAAADAPAAATVPPQARTTATVPPQASKVR
jgi:hypothetical protein